MAKAKMQSKAPKKPKKSDLVAINRVQQMGLDKVPGLSLAPHRRWKRLMMLLRVEWKKECPDDSKAPAILWTLPQISAWNPKGKPPSGAGPDSGTPAGDYFDKLEAAFGKRSRGWNMLNTEDATLNPYGKVKLGPGVRRLMSGSADDEGKTQAAQVVVESTNDLDGP